MSVECESLVELEPDLAETVDGADHVDVASIDGEVSLEAFLAGMASYHPIWMRSLYAIRWVFVRLLGLTQDGLPDRISIEPEDVPFEAGETLGIFTVTSARRGRYWIGKADDDHLHASIAVVVEDLGDTRRFHLLTVVHYHRLVGRVYFAVVRPFHYFVVDRMAAAGVSR